MAGVGAPTLYDWDALYDEYLKDNQTEEVFLKSWVATKGLNYTNCSRQFARIERERENHRLAKTRQKLAKLAPIAVDTLEAHLASEDEKVSKDAAVAILDRAGLAPQVATTRIVNLQAGTAQIIIPPLFAGVYTRDAERMLGGPLNIGELESSSQPVEASRLNEESDSGQVGGSGVIESGPGTSAGAGPKRGRPPGKGKASTGEAGTSKT